MIQVSGRIFAGLLGALALSAFATTAAVAQTCGSVNPLLGYATMPYSGPWMSQHRDSANTDFADCEISQTGYVSESKILVDQLHSNKVFPVYAPDGKVWITVDGGGGQPIPHMDYLYAADLSTGQVVVQLGADDGIRQSASWGTPMFDSAANAYFAQELGRPDGTACRSPTEPLSAGKLCGEYLSFSSTGVFRWKAKTDGGALGSQLTSDGKVLVQTWRGTLYVLEPTTGAVLKWENSWPAAAATLPDDLTPDITLNCLFRGQTEDCISPNILAVHPTTGHIYGTEQGFAIGQAGSFVQRWLYDPVTHAITLDANWQTVQLPGGSASSPVVDFSGNVIFISDSQQGLYALDATTGAQLAYINVGFTSAGTVAIAPQLAADGTQIGTYLLPFRQDIEPVGEPHSWVTILRYAPGQGFSLVRKFDGQSGGTGWIMLRNPVAGIADRTNIATRVLFSTIAQMSCGGCAQDGEPFLIVIDPTASPLVSADHLVGINGSLIVGQDRKIILGSKADSDSTFGKVKGLFQIYRPR